MSTVEGPDMAWAAAGACRGADPELFFPVRGEDTKPAKAVCRTCPVRVECLEHALRHEIHGIWGGLSERERRAERRRRRIARRKPAFLDHTGEVHRPLRVVDPEARTA